MELQEDQIIEKYEKKLSTLQSKYSLTLRKGMDWLFMRI